MGQLYELFPDKLHVNLNDCTLLMLPSFLRVSLVMHHVSIALSYGSFSAIFSPQTLIPARCTFFPCKSKQVIYISVLEREGREGKNPKPGRVHHLHGGCPVEPDDPGMNNLLCDDKASQLHAKNRISAAFQGYSAIHLTQRTTQEILEPLLWRQFGRRQQILSYSQPKCWKQQFRSLLESF